MRKCKTLFEGFTIKRHFIAVDKSDVWDLYYEGSEKMVIILHQASASDPKRIKELRDTLACLPYEQRAK